MPEREKPPKPPAEWTEPFGAGLGPDFLPLGRRIVIGPAKDQVNLKRKRAKPGDESVPGEKPEPE